MRTHTALLPAHHARARTNASSQYQNPKPHSPPLGGASQVRRAPICRVRSLRGKRQIFYSCPRTGDPPFRIQETQPGSCAAPTACETLSDMVAGSPRTRNSAPETARLPPRSNRTLSCTRGGQRFTRAAAVVPGQAGCSRGHRRREQREFSRRVLTRKAAGWALNG